VYDEIVFNVHMCKYDSECVAQTYVVFRFTATFLLCINAPQFYGISIDHDLLWCIDTPYITRGVSIHLNANTVYRYALFRKRCIDTPKRKHSVSIRLILQKVYRYT
jgi:hypothetical protein